MGKLREVWKRYRRSCLATLLCILAIGLLGMTDTAEIVELRTHDLRFQLRGVRPTKAKIVLAIIRDSTIKAWPEPTVSWGTHYQKLILQAKAFHANCIGFDVIPAVDMDAYLKEVGAKTNAMPIRSLVDGIEAWPGRVILSNVELNGLLQDILDADGLNGNVGYVSTALQKDDSIRRAELFQRLKNGRANVNFSAILAARSLGIAPKPETLLPLLKGAGDDVEKNRFWINYTLGRRADANTSFPSIPAEKLASGTLSEVEKLMVEGAVIIVGVGFNGSNDNYTGVGRQQMLGVDINAQTIATLVDRAALHRFAPLQEFLLNIATGCLALCFATLLRWGRGALLIGVACSLWFGLAFYLFKFHFFLLPMAVPFALFVIPFIVFHSIRSIQEAFQRAEVEAEFGRRVSPAVRDFLLSNPDNRALGGKRYEGVILFVDIRGFTTYSQTHEASEVVSDLNRLFEEIVPIIGKNGGLINKFTGDGLLAMFGVPNPLANPSQSALNSAVEIMKKSAPIRRTDGSGWELGCSLHLGALIGGNVGEKERQEFTVIGDTVNVAARLEELNKKYSSQIVMSRVTYERLDERPDFTGPLLEPIRGRGSIEIYYYKKELDLEVRLLPGETYV